MLNLIKNLIGGGGSVYWAWGPGTFDNDDAADWIWMLQDEGALAVENAVSAALDSAGAGRISLDDGHRAIAAAEAVAFALGRPGAELDEEQTAAMADHSEAIAALPDIRKRSVQAVIAVLGQGPDGQPVTSDVARKWEKSGSEAEFKAFMAAVEDVAVRVKG